MPPRLIAFLGTGPYEPCQYALNDVCSSVRTYVQAALVEIGAQAKPPVVYSEVIVFETAAARDKHHDGLAAELESIPVKFRVVPIPDGKNEAELWRIFELIGEAMHAPGPVVLDVTHGFRSLPVSAVLAATFFRSLRGNEVQLRYGAYEPGRPEGAAVPVFDLTPMFELPRWANAVAEWQRTGRAEALVGPTKEILGRIRSETHQNTKLNPLVSRLKTLSEQFSLVRHHGIAPKAREVLDAIAEIRQRDNAEQNHPELKPFLAALPLLEDDLKPIANAPGDPLSLDDEYLQSQALIARFLAEKARMLEAYAILVELGNSIAVRALHSQEKIGAEHHQEEVRGAGVSLISLGNPTKRVKPEVRAEFARSLGEEADKLSKVLDESTQARNPLMHAYTGGHWHNDGKAIESGKKDLENAKKVLLSQIEKVSQSLEKVIARAWGKNDVVVPQRVLSSFANLTNHPLSEWSETQRLAAEGLGFGAVYEAVQVPLIDPDWDGERVRETAVRIADEVEKVGIRGAVVQGEQVLSYCLVNELKSLGIRCFAATSERRGSSELQADGSVRKISEFAFVQFREYP